MDKAMVDELLKPHCKKGVALLERVKTVVSAGLIAQLGLEPTWNSGIDAGTLDFFTRGERFLLIGDHEGNLYIECPTYGGRVYLWPDVSMDDQILDFINDYSDEGEE